MRRRILALACRAYPAGYRAARGRELLDTADEVAGTGVRGLAREALSLLAGGLAGRASAGPAPPRVAVACALRSTALVLATANAAVAAAALLARVHVLHGVRVDAAYGPYGIDGWWIAFAALAAALLIALAAGRLRIAAALATASLGLVAVDAAWLANGDPYDARGHFDLFTYAQTSSFPGGRQWLAASAVLALATVLAARLQAPRLARPGRALASCAVLALGLALVAREAWGAFFFLRLAVVALVLLALVLGPVRPGLSLVAAAAVVAVLPSTVAYLAADGLHPDDGLALAFAVVLAVGLAAPPLAFRGSARRRRAGAA